MPYAKKSDSKKKKKAVMKNRMEAFKEGDMHSGKKSGPVVTDRKQAIAIGLSMSGQSKKHAKKKEEPKEKEHKKEHLKKVPAKKKHKGKK